MTGQSSQSRVPVAGPHSPSTPTTAPPLGMRMPGALVPSCQPGSDLARRESVGAEEREAEQQASSRPPPVTHPNSLTPKPHTHSNHKPHWRRSNAPATTPLLTPHSFSINGGLGSSRPAVSTRQS